MDNYPTTKKHTHKGFSYLTSGMRKKIEKFLNEGMEIKKICIKLNIPRATLYYERMRMGCLSIKYDAEKAEADVIRSSSIHMREKEYLPKNYKGYVTKIYKYLKSIGPKTSQKDIKETIENCLFILEKMGADHTKQRTPVTGVEFDKMVDLWNDGKSLNEIERIMKRSRSTVYCIIEESKKIKGKNATYEHIRNKWANEIDK